jgi:hypothetical protein
MEQTLGFKIEWPVLNVIQTELTRPSLDLIRRTPHILRYSAAIISAPDALRTREDFSVVHRDQTCRQQRTREEIRELHDQPWGAARSGNFKQYPQPAGAA